MNLFIVFGLASFVFVFVLYLLIPFLRAPLRRVRFLSMAFLFVLPAVTVLLFMTTAKVVQIAEPREQSILPQSLPQDSSPQMSNEAILGMVSRLEQKMESDPKNAEGWLMLSRSYRTLGRSELQGKALQNLLNLEPNHPEGLFLQGLYLIDTQNYTQAKAVFAHLRSILPENAPIFEEIDRIIEEIDKKTRS